VRIIDQDRFLRLSCRFNRFSIAFLAQVKCLLEVTLRTLVILLLVASRAHLIVDARVIRSQLFCCFELGHRQLQVILPLELHAQVEMGEVTAREQSHCRAISRKSFLRLILRGKAVPISDPGLCQVFVDLPCLVEVFLCLRVLAYQGTAKSGFDSTNL
jgi:hypothetical protein